MKKFFALALLFTAMSIYLIFDTDPALAESDNIYKMILFGYGALVGFVWGVGCFLDLLRKKVQNRKEILCS